MNSRTRLLKELKDIQKNKTDTGIQLIPDENDIYKWQAVITVRDQIHLAFLKLAGQLVSHDHSVYSSHYILRDIIFIYLSFYIFVNRGPPALLLKVVIST